MSLRPCPGCGRPISKQAKNCPGCGHHIIGVAGMGCRLVGMVVLAIFAVICFVFAYAILK